MHLCCQSTSACELIILPDIEMETRGRPETKSGYLPRLRGFL
ncbi:hypothetical protein ASZ90_012779 [hydrocarbon metagenome]|uniref:Uncharacterized protein n=1 Tax=hydrocarbon metagenome TaxID=938273 RepID=A0A0W8F9D2_9ZZZZ